FLLPCRDIVAPLVALLDDGQGRHPAGGSRADQNAVVTLRQDLVALIPGLQKFGPRLLVFLVVARRNVIPRRTQDGDQGLVIFLADGVGQGIGSCFGGREATQLRGLRQR